MASQTRKAVLGKNHRSQHREPNDGTTEEKAWRLCIFCFCNSCNNKNNDMLHLIESNSTTKLDDDFVNFLISNIKNQPEITKPIFHDKDLRKCADPKAGAIPCKFCILGSCKSWQTDSQFKHIIGHYHPLNKSNLTKLKDERDIINSKRVTKLYEALNAFEKNGGNLDEFKNILNIKNSSDVSDDDDDTIDNNSNKEPEKRAPSHRISIAELRQIRDSIKTDDYVAVAAAASVEKGNDNNELVPHN